MRASNGSRIILCLLVGLVVETREARADFAQCPNPLPDCTATSTGCCKKAFAPASGKNALVIAMDRCHQPVGSSGLSPPGSGAPRIERSIASISRCVGTGPVAKGSVIADRVKSGCAAIAGRCWSRAILP